MRNPTVGLRLQVWVIKANGRKKLVRNRWSRSFVQQWIDIWHAHFRDSTSVTVRNVGGTYVANYYSHTIDTTVQGNVDTFGIVVGSGAAAVSVADYKLQTQILHGGTPGKLLYTVGKVCDQIFTATGRRWFDAHRCFNNVTAYEVAVREVGIYARDVQTSGYFCIVRDEIGSVIAPPLGGITVRYSFEFLL